MAGTIITVVILFICMLVFVILGAIQCRSKNPVGFWTGIKPPDEKQVRDIPAYNKRHGGMWILYGIGIPVSFFAGMPFGETAAWICMMAECVGGCVGMMVCHEHLNKKYLKKEGE